MKTKDWGSVEQFTLPLLFRQMTTMKELELSKCDISDVGAESLARALAVNSSLEALSINDNKIGDSGIAHIATTLQTNTSTEQTNASKTHR